MHRPRALRIFYGGGGESPSYNNSSRPAVSPFECRRGSTGRGRYIIVYCINYYRLRRFDNRRPARHYRFHACALLYVGEYNVHVAVFYFFSSHRWPTRGKASVKYRLNIVFDFGTVLHFFRSYLWTPAHAKRSKYTTVTVTLPINRPIDKVLSIIY